jgi:hypothetical protein
MKYEDDAELAFVSSDFVDNKFYVTVNYDPTTASFQGIVALDFANINQLGHVGNPSYDGLYSGFLTKELFSARYNDDDSLFALIVDQGELSVSALANPFGNQDQVGGRIFPIKSRIYTKSFDFQNPFSEKKVDYVELWLKDIVGPVDVNIYWATEGYSLYCLATSSHIEGTAEGSSKEMPRMRMVLPFNFSDPTSFDGMNRASNFRFVIEITGSATVCKFAVHGNLISEQPNSCVQETEVIPLLPSPTAGVEIVNFYNSYS